MKKLLFAVYGANGFGREVMPLARTQLCKDVGGDYQLVFIDDNIDSSTINKHRVLSFVEFTKEAAKGSHIALAVGNTSVREKLALRCYEGGFQVWSVIASNVFVMDSVAIGQGAILCPFVTLTVNIQIGSCFHANLYSYVGHDSIIGDYVTFAPGVKCNGNVVIEDQAYIGAGAILKQGISGKPLVIGKGSVVGMGAVVTKSVPPGSVVAGNPAKHLEK